MNELMSSEKFHWPLIFKHRLGGLNCVVGSVSVLMATGGTLPSKWSMPDPRGGP